MANPRYFILRKFYCNIIDSLNEFVVEEKVRLNSELKSGNSEPVFTEEEIDAHWKIFDMALGAYVQKKLYPNVENGGVDEKILEFLYDEKLLQGKKSDGSPVRETLSLKEIKVRIKANTAKFSCAQIVQHDAFNYYLGIPQKRDQPIGFTSKAVRRFCFLFEGILLHDNFKITEDDIGIDELFTDTENLFVQKKEWKNEPAESFDIKEALKKLMGYYVGAHLDNDYPYVVKSQNPAFEDGCIRTIKLRLEDSGPFGKANELKAILFYEFEDKQKRLTGKCLIEEELKLIRLDISGTNDNEESIKSKTARVSLYFNIAELKDNNIKLQGVYAGHSEKMKKIQCGCIVLYKVDEANFNDYKPTFYNKDKQVEKQNNFINEYDPEIDLMECFHNHVDSIGKCVHKAFRANYTAIDRKYDGPAGTFTLLSVANSENALELVSYPIKINSRGYVVLKNHEQDNMGIALCLPKYKHILLLDFNNKRNSLFNGFYLFNLQNSTTMKGNRPKFKLAQGVSMRVNQDILCQTKRECIITENFDFDKSERKYPIRPNDQDFKDILDKFKKPEEQKIIKNLFGDIGNLIIADPKVVPLREKPKEDLCDTFLSSSLFHYASSLKKNASKSSIKSALEQARNAAKYGLADPVEFRRKVHEVINDSNFLNPITYEKYTKFLDDNKAGNDILGKVIYVMNNP